MADVLDFTRVADRAKPPPRGPVDSGGGSGNDGGMEQRVSKIEAILPTLATKADVAAVRGDLHKMRASLVMWTAGIVLAAGALGVAIIGVMLQIQSSGLQPAPASAPIIINVPGPDAPPAAPAAPASRAE